MSKVSTEPTLPAMPMCWDNAANWKEWNRLNVLARDNPDKPLDHHCNDCMPEFKQRMIHAGRCAYPTVHFVRIIERQIDPHLGRRKDVKTDAVKGVRP